MIFDTISVPGVLDIFIHIFYIQTRNLKEEFSFYLIIDFLLLNKPKFTIQIL